jgi:hypothetical protein
MEESNQRNRTYNDYQISLNFKSFKAELPMFVIFRKHRSSPQEPRPYEDIFSYALPSGIEYKDEDWSSYWISFENKPDFEAFQVTPTLRPDLTCQVLFWSLETATRNILKPNKFIVPKNHFIKEISFIQKQHGEGSELLVVQPYHLRNTEQFGFLFDFHFHPEDNIPFSRKIQQLSLSLDKAFKRNLDYYVDRTTKVNEFIKERQDVFGSIILPGCKNVVSLSEDFVVLPANRLNTKNYVFSDNRESRSQFTGLLEHGPLKPLDQPPRLLFIFREQDRPAARTLALNLRGNPQHKRFTFPGFSSLFRSELEIDGNPIILSDLRQYTIEGALESVKERKKGIPSILPILVLPSDDDSYLIQKSIFSHAEIATQVCTLRILQDENILKWAIPNLALQIFCKAGGYPWKVRPTAERTVIIGISQSHKSTIVNGKFEVDKYFAFSVMTDNSGLFQKIQVLSDEKDPDGYISKPRENLRKVLQESSQQFSRVVIHTSFKLKYKEIDAIQKTVSEAANDPKLTKCSFAVVKVNHRSRFFGTNPNVNSLVPYESTQVKLGPKEYLVWFEGIYPDNPTVTKAFPGPTHLQILRSNSDHTIPDETLLQDLVNLSGANWRGFNAKSSPVSIFYCHLVADYVHDFNERGLPLPAVSDIRPWFL